MSNSVDMEKSYPLYTKASKLLERCAKEDVPTDVFQALSLLTMDIFEDERSRFFTKPEKFVLKLFRRI